MRHVCVAAAALVAGCGGDRTEYGQVSGAVRRSGRPLPRVEVRFVPEVGAPADRPHAAGLTDAAGVYHLRTPPDRRLGAPVGVYRVVVGVPRGDPATAPPRPPAAYTAYTTTPLRRVVVRAGVQVLDFDLPAGE